MKMLNIIPISTKSFSKESRRKGIAGNLLKSLLIVFVLSWVTLLSSCVVAVPGPRYHRHTVVVEQNYRGERHDNGRHRGYYKSDNKEKNHDKGDRHK